MNIKQIESTARNQFVCLAEYRQVKVESISFKDAKNGGMRTSVVARHGLEMGATQFVVTEWLPDGTKVEEVRFPFKKGQTVAVTPVAMAMQSGTLNVRGQIHVLEGV